MALLLLVKEAPYLSRASDRALDEQDVFLQGFPQRSEYPSGRSLFRDDVVLLAPWFATLMVGFVHCRRGSPRWRCRHLDGVNAAWGPLPHGLPYP